MRFTNDFWSAEKQSPVLLINLLTRYTRCSLLGTRCGHVNQILCACRNCLLPNIIFDIDKRVYWIKSIVHMLVFGFSCITRLLSIYTWIGIRNCKMARITTSEWCSMNIFFLAHASVRQQNRNWGKEKYRQFTSYDWNTRHSEWMLKTFYYASSAVRRYFIEMS